MRQLSSLVTLQKLSFITYKERVAKAVTGCVASLKVLIFENHF